MNKVDLILFIGQSNMAGRGITSEMWPDTVPYVPEGIAYEYRAISAPLKLYPVTDSFGRFENNPSGINDIFSDGFNPKTGSMVPAFCNAYYAERNIPIVGVSASKGGSEISKWLPGSDSGFFEDSLNRLKAAKEFLYKEGITIDKKIALFCQGESDGDHGTSKEHYIDCFKTFWQGFAHELDDIFIIKIGRCNLPGEYDRYSEIREAQDYLCKTMEHVHLASDSFYNMLDLGLMKDEYHYYQRGYNICGENAGLTVGKYFLK